MGYQWFVGDEFCGWILQGLTLPAGLSTEASCTPLLENAEMLLDCRLRNICRADLRRGEETIRCFFYFFRHNSLLEAVGTGPPFHILTMSRTLQKQGFESLEVLAALKPRGRLLKWTSLLIARELEAVSELPSTGNHVFQIHGWVDFDSGVAADLARELARFHDSAFFHGDLKSRHVLARRSQGDSSPESGWRFVLVDLEKTRHLPHLPFPASDILAARDLIQLMASLPAGSEQREVGSVREHLVEQYLGQRNISRGRAALIRRILEMYGPGGPLVQGKTVFGGLASQLKRKSPE